MQQFRLKFPLAVSLKPWISHRQLSLIASQNQWDAWKFPSLCLLQFMGKWYEVAVVSSCPHYMKRKSVNPVVATVHLQHAASAPNVEKTSTVFWSDSGCGRRTFYKGLCCVSGFFFKRSLSLWTCRNGTCKQMTSHYGLTDTPGRFSYHVASKFLSLLPSSSLLMKIKFDSVPGANANPSCNKLRFRFSRQGWERMSITLWLRRTTTSTPCCICWARGKLQDT